MKTINQRFLTALKLFVLDAGSVRKAASRIDVSAVQLGRWLRGQNTIHDTSFNKILPYISPYFADKSPPCPVCRKLDQITRMILNELTKHTPEQRVDFYNYIKGQKGAQNEV